MTEQDLKNKLQALDKKDYGAYQSLKGEYDFGGQFSLVIQQVPKDPFAPSHSGVYRVRVRRADRHVLQVDIDHKIQATACGDFLARRFHQASSKYSYKRGTGNSGLITLSQPSQVILERSSVKLDEEWLEVRCFVGLPAKGRRIEANLATKMLLEELPQVVSFTLFAQNFPIEALEKHQQAAEDAEFLRAQLGRLGLVAFIANGSNLARESGVSDRPLDGGVAFEAPKSLEVKVTLPHAGWVAGMGIPEGITLIVGGGYHGKSTLLNALEFGVYNHIPGDGRELCVALTETVKVRAYSGRSVTQTDISPFIKNLPFGQTTTDFSTQNASGSTSQAASIMEALEMNAKVLLMDEDTCATNFMIRDANMQRLVQKKDEPITAYIDKVRSLYQQKQVSTLLVLGGVGDYFEVADQVIQLNQYRLFDVTEAAQKIVRTGVQKRLVEDDEPWADQVQRFPVASSLQTTNKTGKKSLFAKEVHRLNFGPKVIDLTDVEQLLEQAQTKALAHALDYAKQYMDGQRCLKQVIDLVMLDLKIQGLDVLQDRVTGEFAEFRPFELAFALNRLRGLQVTQNPMGSDSRR